MGGLSVLAIEQDWRIRTLIRANLEALGIEVREAVSLQHGLQLLQECLPKLILLDLDLPNTDAVRFLCDLDLRSDGKPVPVILMSAERSRLRVTQCETRLSYLQKPFSAPDLLAGVQKALDNAPMAD
jgi:DNA-binding response OmpR family regulator